MQREVKIYSHTAEATPTAFPRHLGRHLLDEAHLVRLYAKPSASEAKAFGVRHPDRRLGEDGIGEHFVATRRLESCYINASDGATCLTRIIIDWRRATGLRWMRATDAADVFASVSRGDFAAALAEARTDTQAARAIVVLDGVRLSVPDYLVDYDDRSTGAGRRRDVNAAHWERFLDKADADVAAAIAQSALQREQQWAALRALELARTSEVAAIRAWAIAQLGISCASQEPERAMELWLEALEQGDGPSVVRAARLLMNQARTQREELDSEIADRIRSAVLSTHGEGVPPTDFAVILAELSEQRGDLDTLAELYQRANESTVAEIGLIYGRSLVASGDVDAARDVLEATMEHAYETTRGEALLVLAGLYVDEPDGSARAVDAIQEAFELCGTEIADEIVELVWTYHHHSRGSSSAILRRLAERDGVRSTLLTLLAKNGFAYEGEDWRP